MEDGFCTVRLTDADAARVVNLVRDALREHRRLRVCHMNAHAFNLLHRDVRFHATLTQAEVVHLDSAGAQLLCRLMRAPGMRRASYSEIMPLLLPMLAREQRSIYLLGGSPEVARRAMTRIAVTHPDVRIAGVRDGYFGDVDVADVVAEINACRPDVLLIGMGMPRQEVFVHEHWAALECPITMVGGAVIDRLAGDVRDAPLWMQRAGLEWVDRLRREPLRLWRRYLFGNPQAVSLALRHRWVAAAPLVVESPQAVPARADVAAARVSAAGDDPTKSAASAASLGKVA
jgi:N-acetylglucosaminyldiphosphoundecaprenol N-acetyl-beta-D-mannosaminyltransferase